MTELDYLSPQQLGFTDRRTGLLVFGIILILIGALSGLCGLVTPMALVVPQPAGAPRQQVSAIIGAALLYFSVSAACIWCGVGSVMKQRWVRPIVLSLAWIWLLTAALGTLFAMLLLPAMIAATRATMPAGGPAVGVGAGMTIAVVLGGGINIIVPALYIWFFRKPDVRATLEFFDTQARWTDRCPVRVLGLSVALMLCAVWLAMTALTTPILPVFGVMLTGPAARAGFVLSAVVVAAAAVQVFRLRPSGWWLTMILTLLATASIIYTPFAIPLMEIYERSGMSPEQIEALSRMNLLTNPRLMALLNLPLGIIAVGYLLYIRRWFTGSVVAGVDTVH